MKTETETGNAATSSTGEMTATAAPKPPTPGYVVCPACGSDRFGLSRRIYTSDMVGGFKQRSWAAGENSSDEIVCSKCQARLRWDADAQQYKVFEPR